MYLLFSTYLQIDSLKELLIKKKQETNLKLSMEDTIREKQTFEIDNSS